MSTGRQMGAATPQASLGFQLPQLGPLPLPRSRHNVQLSLGLSLPPAASPVSQVGKPRHNLAAPFLTAAAQGKSRQGVGCPVSPDMSCPAWGAAGKRSPRRAPGSAGPVQPLSCRIPKPCCKVQGFSQRSAVLLCWSAHGQPGTWLTATPGNYS